MTSAEELHQLDLYQHLYAPIEVEHQMAFTLPATPGRVIAIALSRGDPDYSDEERDLIDRARPFLIQAWRNAIEHTALRDELAARALGPTRGDGAASRTAGPRPDRAPGPGPRADRPRPLQP